MFFKLFVLWIVLVTCASHTKQRNTNYLLNDPTCHLQEGPMGRTIICSNELDKQLQIQDNILACILNITSCEIMENSIETCPREVISPSSCQPNGMGCIREVRITQRSDTALGRHQLVSCQGSIDLNFLKIFGNIRDIEDDAFDNLSKLQILYIIDAKLYSVKYTWFRNTQNLDTLVLSNNKISEVESGSFQQMKNLEKRSLKENRLAEITHGMFNDLSNAKEVILSKNQILNIEEKAFSGMSNLLTLGLGHNRLGRFFAPEILQDSPNLETLWLYNNQLTQLSRMMFKGLPKLKVLNVAHNKISNIEANTFEDKNRLEILILSDNWLTKLDTDIFPSKRDIKLTQLYINNNRISYLKIACLHRLNGLKKIVIGGNPWQCGCLDIILEWIDDKNIADGCDKPYISGERPICVINNGDSSLCILKDNSSLYEIYRQEISQHQKLEPCYGIE